MASEKRSDSLTIGARAARVNTHTHPEWNDLASRDQPHDPAWLVERHVQVAVGPVHHVAHAAEPPEQHLLVRHPAVLDHEATQLLPDETAHGLARLWASSGRPRSPIE